MNPRLLELQPYPFEKLRALFGHSQPPAHKAPILWSIGEPKHAIPEFIPDIINKEIKGLSSYPLTAGNEELRQAICDWLIKRFALPLGSITKESHVLPCNGTREALFAFAQVVVNPSADALVLMPNPFYQIYEGAAFLAGARPYFVNLTGQSSLVPDFEAVPEAVWRQCQLLYICTPGNPSGAVMDVKLLQKLIWLADEFDFVIASDECYSEIYANEDAPPRGLLQAAAEMGRDDYRRCMVFHSLSKRSSLPGMRSGFVAGDSALIERFKLFRTYHGCSMSPPFQKASTAAWQDENHVKENRALYRQKFKAVLEILSPLMTLPLAEGGFYLWPQTSISDTEFARRLFEEQNLTVLPGSYLSRPAHHGDPGVNRLRMALVAPLNECIEGAERLAEFVVSIKEQA